MFSWFSTLMNPFLQCVLILHSNFHEIIVKDYERMKIMWFVHYVSLPILFYISSSEVHTLIEEYNQVCPVDGIFINVNIFIIFSISMVTSDSVAE